jgi:ribosomal protein S4E
MVYNSLTTYLADTPTELEARIVVLKALRTALDNAALANAVKGGVTELYLNDGQTVVKTGMMSIEAIIKAQMLIDRQINQCLAGLNGRVTMVTDGKNLNGYNYGL